MRSVVLPNDALQRMKRRHPNYVSVLYKEGSAPIRIARLVSSPYLPEGERIFKVTETGIVDVSEEDEVKRRR